MAGNRCVSTLLVFRCSNPATMSWPMACAAISAGNLAPAISYSAGATQVLRWINSATGISTNGMVMQDGSGLSHKSLQRPPVRLAGALYARRVSGRGTTGCRLVAPTGRWEAVSANGWSREGPRQDGLVEHFNRLERLH